LYPHPQSIHLMCLIHLYYPLVCCRSGLTCLIPPLCTRLSSTTKDQLHHHRLLARVVIRVDSPILIDSIMLLPESLVALTINGNHYQLHQFITHFLHR